MPCKHSFNYSEEEKKDRGFWQIKRKAGIKEKRMNLEGKWELGKRTILGTYQHCNDYILLVVFNKGGPFTFPSFFPKSGVYGAILAADD